jgi:photosystem II stability/assembly factor-like uncharacterized protein
MARRSVLRVLIVALFLGFFVGCLHGLVADTCYDPQTGCCECLCDGISVEPASYVSCVGCDSQSWCDGKEVYQGYAMCTYSDGFSLNFRSRCDVSTQTVTTSWIPAPWTERSTGGSAQNWRSITSSSDGTKLAAVASFGNIWTSTDSGATWTERSPDGGTKNWQSIASSTDGTKLGACDSGGIIWVSTDSGVSWSGPANRDYNNWYGITSSSDGTKLAAVVSGGNIWTSANSGATWTEDTIVGSPKDWVGITSSSDGTKLAAVARHEYIWTSTNSGATWTSVGIGFGGWQSIASSSDGTKLAVGDNVGNIWTSTNSGDTWTEDTSVGSVKSWQSIASSSDGTKLAAVVSSGNIWTSTDSGATWTEDTSVGSTKDWRSITSSSDGTKLAAVEYGGNIWTFEAPSPPSTSAWTLVGDDVDGSTDDYLGYSVSMNLDGKRMAVGAYYSSLYEDYGGYVRVFQYDQTNTAWQQMGADIIPSALGEKRGMMVSMSGDGMRVASIGNHHDNSDTSGLVKVHEWNSDSQSWTLMSGFDSTSKPYVVALSADGTRVAFIHYAFPGYYLSVYELGSDETWSQVGNKLNFIHQELSHAVALSKNGNRVVLGFPTVAGSDLGYIQVYELDSSETTWTKIGEIEGDSGAPAGAFGNSVAISADGSRVVVGAPGVWVPALEYADTFGIEPYVRVYDLISGSWVQRGGDITKGQSGRYPYAFGQSVDMSDDGSLIAVRALTFYQNGKSSTLLYRLDTATDVWKRTGSDIEEEMAGDSDTGDGGAMYRQLSLSGDGKYVAIGAFLNDGGGTDAGHVRVYKDQSAPPSSPTTSTRATGGLITTSGDYTIHTFTSSDLFRVSDAALTTVDVLVVGGGGGGNDWGGGGGGGEVFYDGIKAVSTSHAVTVGGGGGTGTSGNQSTFGDLSSGGGFPGIIGPGAGGEGGQSGGSNGNPGGKAYGSAASWEGMGGGGGAGTPGSDGIGGRIGGKGGDGIQSDVSGAATYYGGGGGGSSYDTEGGAGGQGGGSRGQGFTGGAEDGLPDTGGGGGGFNMYTGSGVAGSGGSGIVIVRYLTPALSPSAANTTNTTNVTSPSTSNTTNVTSPPPPNATASPPPPPNATDVPPPPPSTPSPPPPNRLIFGGDYESSATRYSVVTALVVSIINLYMTTKSR